MKKRLFCAFIIAVCLYAVSAAGDESWKQFTTADGLPANEVRAIAEDTSGVLWFGTDGGGVARYDGGRWSVYTEKDGLVNNEARELAFDKDGVLWVGTPRGVSSFDGVKWNTYTTENSGLAANQVTAIAVDDRNRKWFGIYRQGLVCFDGTSVEIYTTEDGLPDNMIHCITFTVKGTMWIGTDQGASYLKGKTWITYNEENSGISSNHVFTIESHGTTMWFGTYNGVSSYDGTSWKVYTAQTEHDILEDRCVYTIDFDDEGTLWCGTTTGMWSYDGTAWKGYGTHNSGLKDDFYIQAILVDSKNTR